MTHVLDNKGTLQLTVEKQIHSSFINCINKEIRLIGELRDESNLIFIESC